MTNTLPPALPEWEPHTTGTWLDTALRAHAAQAWEANCAETQVAFYGALKPTLWHYTSVRALHGMLAERGIWMTNARFTNDPTELEYAYWIFRTVFEEAAGQYAPHFAAITNEIIQRLGTQGALYDKYITCFCEDADVLPQWISYGHGVGGIAIEFDPQGFKPFCAFGNLDHLTLTDDQRVAKGKGARFHKVEYDQTKQKVFVRKTLDAHNEAYLKFAGDRQAGSDKAIRAAFEHYVRIAFEWMLPLIKHPGFAHEREWRAIAELGAYVDEHRPLFRPNGAVVVPYLRLSHASVQLPIKAIRIGASGADAQFVDRSINALLRAFDLGGKVNVQPIFVPWRRTSS